MARVAAGWPAVLVIVACGGGTSPTAVPSSRETPIDEGATATAARPADSPDLCTAWVDKEVLGMSWYIGEYGLLDYVDIDKMPAVIRVQCETLTDAELACAATEQSVATDCLSQAKLDGLRAAVVPLLELPAELRVAAKAAKRCEYQTAMDLMSKCADVPDRFRKLLDRAWASTANVQSPPFACKVGLEVMKMRLAAIGC